MAGRDPIEAIKYVDGIDPSLKTQNLAQDPEETTSSTSSAQKAKSNKFINLPHANMMLAQRIGNMYQSTLSDQGSDLQNKMDYQAKLLKLQSKLPINTDDSGALQLSEEALKILEELKALDEGNDLFSNVTDLTNMTKENMDQLKLGVSNQLENTRQVVKQRFSDLQLKYNEQQHFMEVIAMSISRNDGGIKTATRHMGGQ